MSYNLNSLKGGYSGDYMGTAIGVIKIGGCQNYGPFLDPYYNTAPNI